MEGVGDLRIVCPIKVAEKGKKERGAEKSRKAMEERLEENLQTTISQ